MGTCTRTGTCAGVCISAWKDRQLHGGRRRGHGCSDGRSHDHLRDGGLPRHLLKFLESGSKRSTRHHLVFLRRVGGDRRHVATGGRLGRARVALALCEWRDDNLDLLLRPLPLELLALALSQPLLLGLLGSLRLGRESDLAPHAPHGWRMDCASATACCAHVVTGVAGLWMIRLDQLCRLTTGQRVAASNMARATLRWPSQLQTPCGRRPP
mmetsp:Transcript_37844/g.103217  ORF Transcript_37844/g.103217 Transcript_37844/m.103217 type:complete len:211 (+) Transcript_37844:788-1420(+)